MKPPRTVLSGTEDLFRSRLENIIDLRHELVRLAAAIDWGFFDDAFDVFYSEEGRPGIATRMMVGLHILKHMFDLSDEEVCERWVYDPYFQYFCGEAYFQHALPIDRSSMTRWQDRIGPEGLEKVFQESLGVAHRTGALRTKDLKRVTVDTTVQEKAVAFPTDAKLIHRARERLVRLARQHAVPLRQSYARVGKRALIMQGRYRHAKQHKRANRAMRKLKTYLGRTIRDIRRKTAHDEGLGDAFRRPLWLAERVLTQKRRDPYPKVYSLHAPEVECIGKGKAHKPYEFGRKVSVATTNARAPGGQFVTHMKAFHENPYDGHTLAEVIAEMERWTGIEVERIYVDKGYQGHDYPNKFKVYKSGQKRGITPTIKKELRRRSAIEAVLGHMKTDGRLDRNFLNGRDGDKINAILVGAGYNYRLVLKWLRLLFARIMGAILQAIQLLPNPIIANSA
jgi:IS5 family transposase